VEIGDPNAGRPPKTGEMIAQVLRRKIAEHELRPGEMLPPESALIEQFGVARSGVREALRILESEGLVVVRRGTNGGAKVQAPSVDAVARQAGMILEYEKTPLSDIFRTRDLLELDAVGLIAGDPDEDQLAALDARVAAEGRLLGKPKELAEAEGLFHRVLVDVCGSGTLRLFSATVQHLIHTHANRVLGSSKDRAVLSQCTRAHRAHRRLVELIGAGERDEAVALWTRHLTEGRNYTQKLASTQSDALVVI
jgi:DNA-binding FadR family transcriptional regulator